MEKGDQTSQMKEDQKYPRTDDPMEWALRFYHDEGGIDERTAGALQKWFEAAMARGRLDAEAERAKRVQVSEALKNDRGLCHDEAYAEEPEGFSYDEAPAVQGDLGAEVAFLKKRVGVVEVGQTDIAYRCQKHNMERALQAEALRGYRERLAALEARQEAEGRAGLVSQLPRSINEARPVDGARPAVNRELDELRASVQELEKRLDRIEEKTLPEHWTAIAGARDGLHALETRVTELEPYGDEPPGYYYEQIEKINERLANIEVQLLVEPGSAPLSQFRARHVNKGPAKLEEPK